MNNSTAEVPKKVMETSLFGEAVSIVFACLLTIGLIISVVGNFLTCYVINKSRRLQSTTNYFIVSLASNGLVLSCLLFIVIIAVSTIEGWFVPDIFCKIVAFGLQMCLGVNVFILLSICLDRFYTIIYPLSFKITRTRAKTMSAGGWFLAILIAAPSCYFYQIAPAPVGAVKRCQYTTSWIHFLIYWGPVSILEYVVPFALIWMNYYRVINFVWIFKRVGERFVQRTVNHVPRSKVNILKIILLVTTVDFCCITLVMIIRFWENFIPKVFDIFSFYFVVFFVEVLSKPIIYLKYNSNFRRGCREVLCWSKMKCYRQELYAVTTVSGLAKKNHVSILPNSPQKFSDPMSNIKKVPKSDDSPFRTYESRRVQEDILKIVRENSSTKPARRPSVVFNRSNMLGQNAWPIQQQQNNTAI